MDGLRFGDSQVFGERQAFGGDGTSPLVVRIYESRTLVFSYFYGKEVVKLSFLVTNF